MTNTNCAGSGEEATSTLNRVKALARRRLIVLAPLTALLLAAACGGGSDTELTAPDPSPTAAPSTPTATQTAVPPIPSPTETPRGFVFPETSVVAFLLDSYALRDGEPIFYLTTDLPIIAGTAAARWFQAMDRYVIVFDGLDTAVLGPVCSGASILTNGAFQFISNAPTEAAACDGAPILAEAPAGAYRCGSFLVYVTEIPAGTEGTLYGTLELYRDGVIYGVTSKTRDPAPDAAPIDLSECESLP